MPGGGARAKAVKVEHLADIRADLPGVFHRVERRWWPDGSSCLHIAKWGPRPGDGRVVPWWPPQYSQLPWEQVPVFMTEVLTALKCQ